MGIDAQESSYLYFFKSCNYLGDINIIIILIRDIEECYVQFGFKMKREISYHFLDIAFKSLNIFIYFFIQYEKHSRDVVYIL